MRVKCVICGCEMRPKPPYLDQSELLDLCKSCEKIQDLFLEKRLKEIKDTGERRRKGEKPLDPED